MSCAVALVEWGQFSACGEIGRRDGMGWDRGRAYVPRWIFPH
jgi:hypothetical protein